jgi:hypothetical protein
MHVLMRSVRLVVVAVVFGAVGCAADVRRDGPAVLSEDGTAVIAESQIVRDVPDEDGDRIPSVAGPCDPCDARSVDGIRPLLSGETQRLVVAWPRTPCQTKPIVAVSSGRDRVIVRVSVGPEIPVDGDCDAMITEGLAVLTLAEPLGSRRVEVSVAA